jgi:hypothetical protein
MSAWTEDELTRVGDAEELQVASYRADGSLRPYVTIWVVRSGDDLFVRSAYGPENGWFRRARASRTGRIRAGGVERDVAFVDAAPEVHEALDTAYEEKYRRHPANVVQTVVGPAVIDTTFRLAPADTA